MGLMISPIIGYAIVIFTIFICIFAFKKLWSVDLNKPLFKETIEITFKSKDDEGKKDD
ncbi:hypothetical protein [uncultured Muribaculum sp.]|uniref:hypothetical protein n=1 Tax=uncultured Muribaculum sp. TaxID=1918613 RepID=UPI0025A97BED|nr:hypothetical protein [uncultured Muribaculum sp.]